MQNAAGFTRCFYRVANKIVNRLGRRPGYMLNFFRVYGDVYCDITNDVNVSFAVDVDRFQHLQIFGDPFFFHSGRLYRGIVESNPMVISINADGDEIIIAYKPATLKPGAFRQLFRLGD